MSDQQQRPDPPVSERTSVIIIGTGFSGLGMAIKLKQSGFHDFVILEKAADLGGTWRDNTYPGCGCDIQSHLYSFSFEPNPAWSRMYACQEEIWDYLRHCADKYDLRPHMRYQEEFTTAEFDDDTKIWHVTTTRGSEYTGHAVVSGVGALHLPNIPNLPGIEKFQGRTFHSARWEHDFAPSGKRVAVVGTGASSVQFVPEIAPEAERVHLFQRTPPWVMPKPDRAITDTERRWFRRFPILQRAYRSAIYWMLEARSFAFTNNPKLMRFAEALVKRQIRKDIDDPELRRAVTPDYRMGCKRALISNDYYKALNRSDVDVRTDGIREVTERGVVDGNGVEHEVDAIIYGTGFHVTDAFDHLTIVGRNGAKLSDAWRDGMNAYLGITVSGFPNLFFLLGPNTGLGHNSVVFMIEAQINYVLEALKPVLRGHARYLDVRQGAQDRFNEKIQKQLGDAVWSTGGCRSWYLDENGVNRTLWPGFTWKYWLQTRRVERGDYEVKA